MTPVLNWREIAALAELMRPELEGAFVDRILVPERSRYPGGFIRAEWAIRFTTRRQDYVLIFSARPREPYFALYSGKGPKASVAGTRSPFDLAASKELKGAKLVAIEVPPRERTIVFWFASPSTASERLGLAIILVPAGPEVLLIRARQGDTGGENSATIMARSRAERGNLSKLDGGNANAPARFVMPDGSRAPLDVGLRAEWFGDALAFGRMIDSALEREGFTLRLQAALRSVRELSKQARDRLRQSQTALSESQREPAWQRYGDLLKQRMSDAPPLQYDEPAGASSTAGSKSAHKPFRLIEDYATGLTEKVPCDPQLEPRAQVEKFYSLARRKIRRQQEAQVRLEGFESTLARLGALVAHPPDATATPLEWPALEKLERSVGLGPAATETAKPRHKGLAWMGKVFVAKDGTRILVGRSKDENLELTFKHARGNDIWLHVRGKPGAHVVIPLASGKSAALETLLDAAALAVQYSGGGKWGKTEVDYTFKKYVKRIKDSTEAAYTNNKTILIDPDEARLKRLHDSAQAI